MKLPEKFKLLFSIGSPWIEKFLHQYIKKLPSSGAYKVSKKLYKEISKTNEAIISSDLPCNLELSHVNAQVDTGVFLKPSCKSISLGTLIGVYTGSYELVPADLASCNSYAYDVAQDIHLKKEDLKEVSRSEKPLDTKQDYSIQTNALETGNFTRFINHSSLHPNIEAVVGKLPGNKIEILLFALRRIKPGEQLLSNYGGYYWKALHIIPTDMAPTTYMLDDAHKAELANPISATPQEVLSLLLPLRNNSIQIPDKLLSSSIFKKFKKEIPAPSERHLKKIEEWENIVVERGISRQLSLLSKKKIWHIRAEESFSKGALLGAFAGTLSSKETTHAIKLAKTTKTDLFFDLEKDGNCLKLIEEVGLDGNTHIRPMYDKDTDTLYLLLFAAKKTSQGDLLSLCSFESLSV
ncbi:MAG: SET domain-containing protein [Chlamydiota bacterium]